MDGWKIAALIMLVAIIAFSVGYAVQQNRIDVLARENDRLALANYLLLRTNINLINELALYRLKYKGN